MDHARIAIVQPVPILRYLCVGTNPSNPSISVDAVLFGDQMDALGDAGYIPLTIRHLAYAIRSDASLPTRPVLITFDQGLNSFHEYALPALRYRAMPSTVFVSTGLVGKQSRSLVGAPAEERATMSWRQLEEVESEDVLIGSYGHSQRPLDLMSRWEAGEDLALSRALLEHQLECSVTAMAYPSGLHSSATRAAAARVGYTTACQLGGSVSSNHDDPFSLSRIPIHGGMGPENLVARLRMECQTLPTDGERLRTKARRAVRRVVAIGKTESSYARSLVTRGRRAAGWSSDVDSETSG